MDQTRVVSGYDVEIALGGRYLQYLLLLAVDTGEIPVEATFTTGTGDEVRAQLLVPELTDRTYPPSPEVPPLPTNSRSLDPPFGVEVLTAHPLGADLAVTLWVKVSQGTQEVDLDLKLYVGVAIDTAPDDDGIGLGSVTLRLELLDIDGGVVGVAEQRGKPKAELLAQLKTAVDRDISMTDLGSGGRIGEIHLRKLPADAEREAALGLFLNLVLRAGPQEDNVLGPRGDLTAAQNILEPGADVTFATRAGIFGDFAADAYHRMARRKGSGYHHPVMKKDEKLFDVVDVDAGPILGNQLKVSVEGEYAINNLPDPNFTVHIFIKEGLDADGIMTWTSDADVESSILADILLGVIALAFVPLLGGWSLLLFVALEAAKYVTEAAIAEWVVEEKVDKKVDAGLLDVAPNRFTIARRRWDPFFTTHHQIGLRPGGTLITEHGLALWGKAALTRATEPSAPVVIREAVRDADGAPVELVYRVRNADAVVVEPAPGTHRRPFRRLDPAGEPDLVAITTEEAIARVATNELRGRILNEVQAIEFRDGQAVNLLVISHQEIKEEHNRLLGQARDAAATAAATEEAGIRAEVIAEFDAQGIIPTQEQIDTAVGARLQALIDDQVATYEEGQLPVDLQAALDPLLRLELSPDQFGRLQDRNVLQIAAYDLIELRARDSFYYRDRYVWQEEDTPAKRLADNLHSKRRYRNTPSGREFV